MDTLISIQQNMQSLGIHRHGWLVVAAILVIPAIVSGNMVLHYLTLLIRRRKACQQLIKPILGNLVTALLSAAVITMAMIQY